MKEHRLTATLHNGMTVTIWPIPKLGVWSWQGFDSNGEPHLWRREGHWREDRTPHVLDIKHIQQTPEVKVA